jgi:hypothetical protein
MCLGFAVSSSEAGTRAAIVSDFLLIERGILVQMSVVEKPKASAGLRLGPYRLGEPAQFSRGPRIWRVNHGRDARATLSS